MSEQKDYSEHDVTIGKVTIKAIDEHTWVIPGGTKLHDRSEVIAYAVNLDTEVRKAIDASYREE